MLHVVIDHLMKYGLDFNLMEPETGLTPLMLAIICNYGKIA